MPVFENAALRRRIAPALLALALPAIALASGPPVAGTAGAATTIPSATSYDDAGYMSYAGRMQRRLDAFWDGRAGRYRAGRGGTETATNANLLLAHAVAAAAGDHGPARNDARARRIVSWLVEGEVFVERVPPRAGDQGHAPGWLSAPGAPGMHLVFDAEVIDGLVHAYRARDALGLSARSVDLIRNRIHRVARGRFWRWPAIRLNQINWYALVYAADATVTRDGTALARGFRAQLNRFLRGVRPGGAPAGNLGPGLRFHYLPHEPASHYMNLDSAEYANIVLSFSRFYGQARAAGMPPLRGSRLALMRAWVRRAVAGYWTHGGYMNWDTGLGFKRWHQSKKLGLTQHALVGIASAPELQPSPEYGAWAKHLLDRSLAFYERLALRAGRIPRGVLFGVHEVPQGAGSARLGAARLEANAARAVAAGLGSAQSASPPALYSFDPDTGRLAVTTHSYNTAVVAVNQGAVPYGGIELARLFDADQEVAAGIGGRVPAAFGLRVRARGGRTLLATQQGRGALSRSVTPLRLTGAPSGVGVTAAATSRRAFAGTFRRLRAAGSVRRAGLTAVTRHSFTPAAIETSWSLSRRGGSPLGVDVLFPSWGRRATVTAVHSDGTRVRLSGRRVPLAPIARFVVTSQHTSYSVIPLRRPAGASARIVATSAQSSAPTPGPTLAVELGRGSSARRFGFAARIVVGRR